MKKGNSLGRSIIFLGEHAKIVDIKKKKIKKNHFIKKKVLPLKYHLIFQIG